METAADARIKYVVDYLKGVGLSLVYPGDELIDWRQAAALAITVSEAEQARIIEPWEPLSEEFARLVKEVEPEIAAFTHLELVKPLGYPVVFDRAEWIVTAIETIKPLVEPVFSSLISAVSGRRSGAKTPRRLVQATASVQIGTILGYLAKRVLGQYDLPLAGGEVAEDVKLYFIYPNILSIEERFGLDRREFHLWLALHEATHSYEFEGNPWLRSYLSRLIREHTDFMEDKLKETVDRLEAGKASSSLAGILFTGSFRELMSVETNQTLGRIQAFMSVVEGYSDFVMHDLSQKIIPHSSEITGLFERNKRYKTWAERLLERFMGLDIKLQQYQLGKEFVAAAADHGGIELANAVWAGPENLPTLAEIKSPELWIKRVGS